MLNIGIEKDHQFVYEATSFWGHALWPSPTLTPAKVVLDSMGSIESEKKCDPINGGCLFREDSYDPSARIRRGRFYIASGQQPAEWYVQVHPASPGESREAGREGVIKKRLDTYYGSPLQNLIPKDQAGQPLVILGFQNRFTIWTIINVEAISTGEDLVTLKARTSLGILPQIDETKILKKYRAAVLEALDHFTDEARRSAPVSVIDRARDAVSQMLLAKYKATPDDAKDLGPLTKRLQDDGLVIAESASKIIARLHARAKPVEKTKRKMRPIREQDAELAIQCVGTVLCEFGWADWP